MKIIIHLIASFNENRYHRKQAHHVHSTLVIFSFIYYLLRSFLRIESFITLGPAHNESCYNKNPAILSRFLCIKVIDCNVKMFGYNEHPLQGSHFFGLTKFHDFSRFFSKFSGIFSLFLKYDFQVVLNINIQTY